MSFESGVKGYVVKQCTFTTFFPVDYKDREYIACKYCNALKYSGRCMLTDEKIFNPDIFIGEHCPLKEVDSEYTSENI